MKVKDFVAMYLNDQNITGMALNLIGNFGKTLRQAQVRYPEYGNLLTDKRLWTGKKMVSGCMYYPVSLASDGLYLSDNTRLGDEQVLRIFKQKLWELKHELNALPAKPKPRLTFCGLDELFASQEIWVEPTAKLTIMVNDSIKDPKKEALATMTFFTVGDFSYRDVAYYQLVDADERPLTPERLTPNEVVKILGQLLVFMTLTAITQKDYNSMSAYFSMSNR